MRWWMVFAAALAAWGSVRPSEGCENSVHEAIDPTVLRLQGAEESLRSDRPVEAARVALSIAPGLRTARLSSRGTTFRAARVMAVAIGRVGGALDLAPFHNATPEERAANVAWAVGALRQMAAAAPGNLGLQTDLGEILAMRSETRAEARALLDDLGHRELLTSSHAWLALARLRDASGDSLGRDTALMRCRAMSRRPSTCAVP